MHALHDHKAFAAAEPLDQHAEFMPNRTGRVFDLHPAIHVAVFGGFFAYLGIMWAAFGNAELAIPFVIFAVFLAGSFITPAMWARVSPNIGPKADWSKFLRDGFDCETGHLTARATMAQVLIMPAMLILWGLAIALIRASV
ncbi:hypothetical protein P1X14_10485 [Sphingomonas sp. AOB5]|uniref:hypothetical protein n=1 Tax=Sphingomonas sp. AOB5 TaxID=3034017 RepID=UPI0023F691A3|nr:hypothetical protein [Sphingomonas sp. AOB5]MDF7775673.1 hypothetical protein [Sphingomonas sp. AOB5]